jgi:type III secretion protein C
VQWLAGPNSLVFSGTPDALEKTAALVHEVDKPMRQVFIEMLIMETTLDDALDFGTTFGTRFGGGNMTGSQHFYSGTDPLAAALNTAGLSNLGTTIGNQAVNVPDGTRINGPSGFTLGVIGQKITHCGTEFGSIGALVKAIHDRTKDEVISNPKLLVEDNATAEIFVGLNTPYRTQSISNDIGSVITSNYEYRDVGTRLKVTPYLGNGDIIALDLEEEVSSIVAGLITDASTASTSPGPTTRINRTTTRVHIPDTYFLIISGMMQDEESRERNQVPCLGGIPLIGAAFSEKINKSAKRNLMIFIRPKIVDTEDEVDNLTRHQQDIYEYKNCMQNMEEYETVEALDLMNMKKTLHPEDVYDCECD